MERTGWLAQVVKKELGDIDTAVEVGVWRGDYSRTIIRSLEPKKFIGIDPWELYEGYTDKPGNEFNSQESLDHLYLSVKESFEKDFDCAEIWRAHSVNASKHFENESLDFVYLDADHKYEPVRADIQAWWPKIKPGGILAGHDYIAKSHIEEFGVIKAVDEFREANNLPLCKTDEAFATWWAVKP